jgi:DNA-binding beta-propeller fold protein YncE
LDVPDQNKIIVSHRYSNFLSLIDHDSLTPTTRVLLPGNGGEMVYDQTQGLLYISDYSAGQIYELDLTTQKVLRKLPGMKNMSALWLDDRNPEAPELWMASRTNHRVTVLDLVSGQPEVSLTVGKKPVAFAPNPVGQTPSLLVISASDDRVDVLDLTKKSLHASIDLEVAAFPTGVALSGQEQRAFVTAAGNDSIYVVDLIGDRLERTIPLSIRGMSLVLVGEPEATLPADGLPPLTESSSEGDPGQGDLSEFGPQVEPEFGPLAP